MVCETDILDMMPYVEMLARKMTKGTRRGLRAERVDELTSAGYAALVTARRTCDADKGTTFRTHATRRARWAMLTEMRWLRYWRYVPVRGDADRKSAIFESGGDDHDHLLERPDQSTGPAELAASKDHVEFILRHVAPRERHILRRYVLDGWTMRRIGEELGLTETRISQLLKASTADLKRILGSRRRI